MNPPTLSSNVLNQFRSLDSKDVVQALKARLEIEQIAQHFDVIDYQFHGSLLEVTKLNSILMRFTTLQNYHPTEYDSSAYKLLLLLDLKKERSFKPELQLELKDLTRKDNIDKTIIWTSEQLPSTVVQSLKNVNADAIMITEKEVQQIKAISNFIPISNRDYEYAVALNVAADLLLKRLKKLFHLVLSEVAAPIYDKLYGKMRIATNEMMKFEEEIVSRVTNKLKDSNRAKRAVDVGCGTGRHTFPLAKTFAHVFAFDFSPSMIDRANHIKKRDNVTNIMFSVADLEYEEIVDEQKFYGTAGGRIDLVVASFGLASFIEDTPQLLRRFHSWLREDGMVILSFYNKQSIILQVTPNWGVSKS